MQVRLERIPEREVLHFLGWRGTPVEPQLMEQISALSEDVIKNVQPRVLLRRFLIEPDGRMAGTSFLPEGQDIGRLLAP